MKRWEINISKSKKISMMKKKEKELQRDKKVKKFSKNKEYVDIGPPNVTSTLNTSLENNNDEIVTLIQLMLKFARNSHKLLQKLLRQKKLAANYVEYDATEIFLREVEEIFPLVLTGKTSTISASLSLLKTFSDSQENYMNIALCSETVTPQVKEDWQTVENKDIGIDKRFKSQYKNYRNNIKEHIHLPKPHNSLVIQEPFSDGSDRPHDENKKIILIEGCDDEISRLKSEYKSLSKDLNQMNKALIEKDKIIDSEKERNRDMKHQMMELNEQLRYLRGDLSNWRKDLNKQKNINRHLNSIIEIHRRLNMTKSINKMSNSTISTPNRNHHIKKNPDLDTPTQPTRSSSTSEASRIIHKSNSCSNSSITI